MPRSPRIPAYRLHKPSGQAVCRLSGRDYYLGRHGSRESRQEYERLIAEWLAGGRHLARKSGLFVSELIDAYLAHAEVYYHAEGRPTTELPVIRSALAHLRHVYGSTRAADVGPLALKAVRQRMIDAGLSRNTANAYTNRIRRAFRWAASNELVPPAVYEALRAVPGLPLGRGGAERESVEPVPAVVVEATLPHLDEPYKTIVRLLRLTGMRPGEGCAFDSRHLDRTGDIWIYRPGEHKTAWRGTKKMVALGPQAQLLLRPFLSAQNAPGHVFLRERSVGPIRPNRLRTVVLEAAEKAGVPAWSPNQLRHLRATEVRARYGIEAAQAVLGHSELRTTQVYAEVDMTTAQRVAREIG